MRDPSGYNRNYCSNVVYQLWRKAKFSRIENFLRGTPIGGRGMPSSTHVGYSLEDIAHALDRAVDVFERWVDLQEQIYEDSKNDSLVSSSEQSE